MFLKTCFTAYCLYNCGICYTFVRLFAEKSLWNIWWNQKKCLPLRPQTRNKRPSRRGKRRNLGSE